MRWSGKVFFKKFLKLLKTKNLEHFLEARKVMFYEVKVFDAKGELKKVLSPKKLSNKFWKEGEQKLVDFTDKDSASANGDKKSYSIDEFQLEDS